MALHSPLCDLILVAPTTAHLGAWGSAFLTFQSNQKLQGPAESFSLAAWSGIMFISGI